MRVIVSTTLEDDYNDFIVVDSFKKVKDIENVTLLVLHEFDESDFDVGVFIAQFSNMGIKNFIYINENPKEMVKSALVGVKGRTYTDTFYLTDEEELLALEDDFEADETTELSTCTESTKIIKDFLERFKKGDTTIQAPVYLEQVNYALQDLSGMLKEQSNMINVMGNSTLETFEKANVLISNMAKQRNLLEEKLQDITENPAHTQPMRTQFGSNIFFFPSTKYTGTPKMLLIREVSHCRYLTSFMLAYEHYLHYEKNKRVKLIFVHPKGQGVSRKYSMFTSITQESMHMASLYESEIIATNNPKQDVMKKLFQKQVDIFIVVDRLYGSQDIVTGRVNKLTAVSGGSDIKRYNLKEENSIFSTSCNEKYNPFILLPTIKNYPDSAELQKVAYMQVCKNTAFDKLNNFLDIRG